MKEFKGVWIPKEILEIEILSSTEKILLSIIYTLDQGTGCTASNKYFAEKLNISTTQASLIIKNLYDLECISPLSKVKGGVQVNLNRAIKYSYRGGLSKVKAYIKEDRKVDNKEENKKLSNESAYGNPDINILIDFFKDCLGVKTLDGTVKHNRWFCQHVINRVKKDYPDKDTIGSIKAIIQTCLKKEDFHAQNLTNFKYLYYNFNKIVNAIKSKQGRSYDDIETMADDLSRK